MSDATTIDGTTGTTIDPGEAAHFGKLAEIGLRHDRDDGRPAFVEAQRLLRYQAEQRLTYRSRAKSQFGGKWAQDQPVSGVEPARCQRSSYLGVCTLAEALATRLGAERRRQERRVLVRRQRSIDGGDTGQG